MGPQLGLAALAGRALLGAVATAPPVCSKQLHPASQGSMPVGQPPLLTLIRNTPWTTDTAHGPGEILLANRNGYVDSWSSSAQPKALRAEQQQTQQSQGPWEENL